LLEKGPQEEKDILFETVRKNFIKLSKNKFASNVTEKSVFFGTMEYKRQILTLLMNKYEDDPCPLMTIMSDSFGNYVVQRLFEVGDDGIKNKLFQKLRQFDFNEIRKNQYAKHVLDNIEKYMEENQRKFNNNPMLN